MMASQKVRPPALQRLFKTSSYNLYAFTLEQPLKPWGAKFLLSHLICFCKTSKDDLKPRCQELVNLDIFVKNVVITLKF
jgi:hypothetical protein